MSEKIQLKLKEFGLTNFNIHEPHEKQMVELVTTKQNIGLFIVNKNKLIYEDCHKTKEFMQVKFINKGAYNQIYMYTSDDIEYVARITLYDKSNRKSNSEILIDSLTENFKHLILHLVTQKIVPIIYYIGITKNKDNEGKDYIITIMEKGEYCLSDYYAKIKNNEKLTQQMMLSIYKLLETLKTIHFKHGDLTDNNIVITKDLNPLLIDFGRSSFIIEDIYFPSEEENMINFKDDSINITHDMILLFVCLYKKYDNIVFDNFKFKNNIGSYILDGDVLKKYLKEKGIDLIDHPIFLNKLYYNIRLLKPINIVIDNNISVLKINYNELLENFL